MQDWQRRLRFYHDSVLLDGVFPTLGAIGLAWLIVSGSDSTAAYFACAGAISTRGAGSIAEWFRSYRKDER